MNINVRLIVIFLLCFFAFAEINSAEDLQSRFFAQEQNSLKEQFSGTLSSSSEYAGSNNSQSGGELLQTRKKINRSGAMLSSLLVPGWGEHYLGYKGTAKAFFWTDVAIWASLIGFETYSQWKEDQFIAFAATHAEANMSGKNDDYYADIGNYINTEAYNEAKLRYRDYESVYTDPSYYWAWDSDENRMTYDHMRIQSRSAHNKVFIMLGAAALNRLISFIDTGKKARDFQKRQQSLQLGIEVRPESSKESGGVQIVFRAEF